MPASRTRQPYTPAGTASRNRQPYTPAGTASRNRQPNQPAETAAAETARRDASWEEEHGKMREESFVIHYRWYMNGI